MSTLLTTLLLITVTERVTAALVAPIKQKYPNADLWWLIYVAWVLGAVLVFLAGINLFAELVPSLSPLAGQVLSAIVAGGGANLLHDIFDRPTAVSITASGTDSSSVSATATVNKPPAPFNE